MGLDQLQEIGDDLSLRAFQQPLASIKNLDARDLPRHGRVSSNLQLKTGQGNLEVGREPRFLSISTGEEVMLCQVALIVADIDVVKLGSVAGLDLNLLGHFPAGVDPVALKGAEDGSEAAFLCFVKRLSSPSIISLWEEDP